jgi:PAS domain S-box-containing protein
VVSHPHTSEREDHQPLPSGSLLRRVFIDNVALRVCLIYAIVSVLWIFFSDQLVYSFAAGIGDAVRISMIKGILFVFASSVLIYFLVIRGIRTAREGERDYRSLIETSPDAIVMLDGAGKITLANHRLVHLLRHEKVDDLLGRKLKDMIAESDRPSLDFVLQAMTSSGGFNTMEFQALRKDGSTVPVDISASPKLGNGSGSASAVAIIHDISIRKQAEKAFRDAERNYRDIFDHAGEGIYQSTPSGHFLAANPRLAEVLGYESPGELMSAVRNIEEQLYVDRAQRDLFRQKMEECGEVKGFVYQLLRKDGKKVWVAESARIVQNGSYDDRYFEGTLQDITEQKRIQDALQESEERYRSLVELSPDAIVVHSKGLVVFANAAAVRLLLASSSDDLVGRSIFEFVPPEYHGLVQERARMTGQEGKIAPLVEEKFLRLDGTPVDVEVVAIPFTYNGEAATQVVVRDVTERNQAEREIRLLAQTVASTKDCVSITDLNDRILFVNDAFVDTFGYERDELIGKDVAFLRSPSTAREMANQILPATMAGGWYGEIYNRKKSGEVFPIELWTSMVKNENDEPVAMVGVARDITARKLAEESMRKLLHAIEQSDEVIFMTEVDGTITYVNPSFERVYGYSKDVVIGETPRILKSGTVADKEYESFWNRLLTGESIHLEIINRTSSGNLVTMESSVNPVLDDRGMVAGFIAVQNDVTDRKRAEEERKTLEAQLFQAQKIESIGTLAGGIAHDFNNILGIILGHATLLDRMCKDPASFLRSRDAIVSAVQRGAGLVKQILTFARKTEVTFEQVDVNETIQELVRMLQETFPKTISFSLDLSSEVAWVTADRTQLHQTLLNLCVNARDAMPDGGLLTARTERVEGSTLRRRFADARAGQYAGISISDSGTGMDESTRQRIFEPFFTTKPTGKGTGLGLSVVDGIMRSHQGFIDVKSAVGLGTTFILYFPLSGAGMTHRESGGMETGAPAGGRETILVVEDEEELLVLIRTLLESAGYRVLSAMDGAEATRVFQERRSDIALVISDLGLPHVSGAEVFRQMKRIDPAVKSILVSGYFEPDAKAHLMKEGAAGFMQKPYIPSEVLARVREVLDAR